MHAELNYDQSTLQGEVVTAKHFGLNFIYGYERVGDLPWEKFDEIVEAVEASVVRYPGGSVTENFFDIQNPNATEITLSDGTVRKVIPLNQFLAYTNSNNINPIIVIPTKMSLTETYTQGHRDFDSSWEDIIYSYVLQVLTDSMPAGVLTFELGNEYESFMTPTEYGRVASSIAEIVDRAIEDFWLEREVPDSLARPKIAVQIWGEAAGEGKSIDDLISHNSSVLAEFNPSEISAIDAVVSHLYFREGRHTGKENEHNYENIDTIIGISADLVNTWNENSNNIEYIISEWNVSHNGAGNTGLAQIPVLLEMFSSFLVHGVEQLDFWSARYQTTSLANPNGTLGAAGNLFSLMQTYLVGSHVSDLSVESEEIDIHAFESEDSFVFFVSSLVTEQVNVNLGMETILNEFAMVSAILIGVDQSSADGNYKELTDLPIYLEPDVTFNMSNIFNGGAIIGNGFNLDIAAYETVVFIFKKVPEFEVSGINETGTIAGEMLEGSADDDFLRGLLGDDRLLGYDGSDWLYGGDGSDTINGGAGDDMIFGGFSSDDTRDLIYGGNGNDTIDAGYGNDLVYGGEGDDAIIGNFGADELLGQQGNDIISGSALSDMLWGGSGDDFLNGGYGHDRLNGGQGADKFFHLGIRSHGSDWVQDYSSEEKDFLVWGDNTASFSDFQVNFAETPNAGTENVSEAFVIFVPTGQIIWALVDGSEQTEILLSINDQYTDLLV